VARSGAVGFFAEATESICSIDGRTCPLSLQNSRFGPYSP
jgi:hypothetical protein